MDVSVLMCTGNDSRRLSKTRSVISACTIPSGLCREVVVVTDACTAVAISPVDGVRAGVSARPQSCAAHRAPDDVGCLVMATNEDVKIYELHAPTIAHEHSGAHVASVTRMAQQTPGPPTAGRIPVVLPG